MGGHIIVGATIVTYHFVHFQMEGQRHIAACAVRRPSTAAALEHRTVATAIEKHYGLLSLLESGFYLVAQSWREGGWHQAFAAQFSHVFHHNFGHRHLAKALVHGYIAIFSLLGVGISLYGGGGSAEEHLCPCLMCHEDGGIACMIARSRVLLFIARFVLFVDDHQT